jgi:hypothetical protein
MMGDVFVTVLEDTFIVAVTRPEVPEKLGEQRSYFGFWENEDAGEDDLDARRDARKHLLARQERLADHAPGVR